MTTGRIKTVRNGSMGSALPALVLLFAAFGAGPGACGGAEVPAASSNLCEPGENIFCRCTGGAAGTKTCKADGQGFEVCIGRDGACTEPSTTTSTDPTTGTDTPSGGAGGVGQGGNGQGGTGQGGGNTKAEYLAPCGKDPDCTTGRCAMGYCTKDCAKPEECKVDDVWVADCIAFADVQVCMPICLGAGDCALYGYPSDCGFTHSVDGVPDTVCADWGPDLAMPPNGTTCFGDTDCNLGHLNAQRICVYQKCGDGCHIPDDCPKGQSCSASGGTPGTCK